MPYYQLHPDTGMNFQMNRVLTYGEEAGCFEEIQDIAKKIQNFDDWYVEWLGLAQKAEREGRYLHAFYAYRMAEFFLTEGQPEKANSYHACMECFLKAIPPDEYERFEVPYEGETLPAIRMQAPQEKAVMVVHGGYDSFMEEFYLGLKYITRIGYTVILFEGPGQGTALRRGLKLTHEWDKPVAAVLDHFDLSGITMMGVSLGGCLALRAAAFEPRIERVIAYDIMFDLLDGMAKQLPAPVRGLFKLMVKVKARELINRLANLRRRKNMLANWGIAQGMYVTGADTPFELMIRMSEYSTRDISHLVKQDVLLLAGEKDHYVPVHQLSLQEKALVNARTVTSRLFTEEEGGEQHCQVGNIQLVEEKVVEWLEEFNFAR